MTWYYYYHWLCTGPLLERTWNYMRAEMKEFSSPEHDYYVQSNLLVTFDAYGHTQFPAIHVYRWDGEEWIDEGWRGFLKCAY